MIQTGDMVVVVGRCPSDNVKCGEDLGRIFKVRKVVGPHPNGMSCAVCDYYLPDEHWSVWHPDFSSDGYVIPFAFLRKLPPPDEADQQWNKEIMWDEMYGVVFS